MFTDMTRIVAKVRAIRRDQQRLSWADRRALGAFIRAVRDDLAHGRGESPMCDTLNLDGGDHAKLWVWYGPRGGLHHCWVLLPGHVTDEWPTGGEADMIRHARRDCCLDLD